jgi:hypothetical protein
VKSNLIERVAKHLRARLEQEGAELAVPSCRELATALKVSVPTAMGALRLLAADGFLTRDPRRKRYQLADVAGRESSNPTKRLLVIRSAWNADLDAHSRLRVERLVMEAATTGWTVKEEVLSYGSERRRIDRRWDELIKRFQPSRIVASPGTPLLAKWAASTGVDTLFVGGSAGPLLIPTLGVSMSASLRSLLPRLLERGERLVSMPLCDYGPEFIEAFRRAFSDCLSGAGLPFVPTYHTPATTERGPEALRAMLEMVLKAKPPTTLIFANWRPVTRLHSTIRQCHRPCLCFVNMAQDYCSLAQ